MSDALPALRAGRLARVVRHGAAAAERDGCAARGARAHCRDRGARGSSSAADGGTDCATALRAGCARTVAADVGIRRAVGARWVLPPRCAGLVESELLWCEGVGLDHAGIATQSVVERSLRRQGRPDSRALGREAFVAEVRAVREYEYAHAHVLSPMPALRVRGCRDRRRLARSHCELRV